MAATESPQSAIPDSDQMEVGDRQWAVGSGQWAVGSGQDRSDEEYRELQAGHWGEFQDYTTPDGSVRRRGRSSALTDPPHPNNGRGTTYTEHRSPETNETEYSANETEEKAAPGETEYSVRPKTEYSASTPPCHDTNGEVVDLAEFRAKLSTQSAVVYDKKRWKRSREKPGFLIKRIKGYNPVEDKYGVSYLYVLSRKPDRTSSDYSVYPFAGFFNWEALATTGLFVKERKSNAKRQRK